ncbi:MAG: hypothetical protein AB7S26_02965 [Sandaracinaceae bacterium]
MNRRRVSAFYVLLVSVATGVSSSSAQPPREALLVGSSSVNGALGRTIEHELGQRGVTVRRRARSSSGFARPDFFDWEGELAALGPYEPLSAVIVYTGGNDTQALRLMDDERTEGEGPRVRWVEWRNEDRWVEVYRARVRRFVDELCTRGAPRVIVILPVDGGRPGWSRRIVRVREAMAAGVTGSRCGVTLDAGDETFDSTDGVHLSREGARWFWRSVGERLVGLITPSS